MASPPVGGNIGDPGPATAASASASGTGDPRGSINTGAPDLSSILKGMNNITDAQILMVELSGKMKVALEEIPKTLREVVDQYKKVQTGLKDGVDDIEETVDHYDVLVKKTKEFNKNLNDTNRGGHKRLQDLKQLITAHETLVRSGKMHGRELENVTRQLAHLKKGFQDASAGAIDLTNPSHLKPFQVGLDNMLRTIKTIGIQYKSINSTGLNARRDNMRAAFSQAGFYMKPGYRDRAVRMGQLAANLKANTAHHTALSKEAFEEKMGKVRGFGGFINRKPSGEVDWKAFSKKGRTPEFWEKLDTKATARQMGGGGIESYALGRLANAKAGKGTLGFGTKAILGMMEKGEGSALRGVGAWGMGLAEKGMGMGAGAMAIPGVGEGLALLSLVRTAFDKQIEINQGIEKNLGTAGIFAPGAKSPGVFQNLSRVQANLMPATGGGFYNTMGITYKKNMEVAQAMAASGMGLSELQQGEGMYAGKYAQPGSDTKQWGPGTYGAIQHTAYTTARLAGYDTAAGTAQAVKLIQTYGQSLTATNDFFLTLNKDAKAAGMTTIKYVSIIDDVTSGLGRMNKSFTESVNIIRTLGRTGGTTAQDIKDYFEAITGGGAKKELPVSSFLFGTATQGEKADYREITQNRQEELAGGIAKSIQEAHLSGRMKGYTKENLAGMSAEELRGLLPELARAQGDEGAKTGIGGQIREAITNKYRSDAAREFAAGKINAVQMASVNNMLGSDIGTQVWQQNQALEKTLKPFGGNIKKAIQSPLSGGLFEAFGGGKSENFEAMIEARQIAAGGVVDKLRNKTTTPAEKAELIARYANVVPGGAKAMSRMAETQPGKLEDLLTKSAEIGTEVLKSQQQSITLQEKIDADNAARDLNVATKSSADIFADAFEHLFMLIVKPVNDILDALPWHGTQASGGERTSYNAAYQNVAKDMQNLQNAIDDTSGKYKPEEKEKFRQMISSIRTELATNATGRLTRETTADLNQAERMGSNYQSTNSPSAFGYVYGEGVTKSAHDFGPLAFKKEQDEKYSEMANEYLNTVVSGGINPATNKPYTGKLEEDESEMLPVMNLSQGLAMGTDKHAGQLAIPTEDLMAKEGGESKLALYLDRAAGKKGGLFGADAWGGDHGKYNYGTDSSGKSVVYVTLINNNAANWNQFLGSHPALVTGKSEVVSAPKPVVPAVPGKDPKSTSWHVNSDGLYTR
jgi:hypothetical protein